MEKKQLSLEKMAAGDFDTIAVITESIITWHSGKYGAMFFVRKQPLYVISFNADRRRILKISGEEIPYEELIIECSAAGELIDNIV